MAEQYAPTRRSSRSPSTSYRRCAGTSRLRHVRLDVAGAELAELGLEESPRVGEILGGLRRRKLDGELDGRDAGSRPHAS